MEPLFGRTLKLVLERCDAKQDRKITSVGSNEVKVKEEAYLDFDLVTAIKIEDISSEDSLIADRGCDAYRSEENLLTQTNNEGLINSNLTSVRLQNEVSFKKTFASNSSRTPEWQTFPINLKSAVDKNPKSLLSNIALGVQNPKHTLETCTKVKKEVDESKEVIWDLVRPYFKDKSTKHIDRVYNGESLVKVERKELPECDEDDSHLQERDIIEISSEGGNLHSRRTRSNTENKQSAVIDSFKSPKKLAPKQPKKPAIVKIFECSSCPYKCQVSSSLKRHLSVHRNHPCHFCDLKFKTKTQLNHHLKGRTERKLFSCSFCPAKFCKKLSLDSHSRSDHFQETHGQLKYTLKKRCGKRVFACMLCPSAVLSMGSFKVHFRSHTGERPYKCAQCSASFVCKSHLRVHVISAHCNDRSFICSYCPASFKSKSALKDHLMTHSDSTPFSCAVCQKKFKFKANLRKHMIVHSNEMPHQCTLCFRRFRHLRTLKDHAKVHSNERRFSCNVCLQKFKHSSSYKLHLKIHKGKKLFTCGHCEMKFRTKGNLEYHLKWCTVAEVYRCHWCGCGVRGQKNFTKHLNVHLKANRLLCVFCSVKFDDISSYNFHLFTHNKGQPVSCNYCSFKINTAKNSRSAKRSILAHVRKHKLDC